MHERCVRLGVAIMIRNSGECETARPLRYNVHARSCEPGPLAQSAGVTHASCLTISDLLWPSSSRWLPVPEGWVVDEYQVCDATGHRRVCRPVLVLS
jgi:hypothetical protein